MGLSSWLQNALAGKNSPARKTRQAREDFVQLFLTRLEDRRVLNADFALVADPMAGNTLVLSGFTAGETLTVRENGANYEFQLAMNGVWNDLGSMGVGTAAGEILSVAKTDLDPLSGGLRIIDPMGNDLDINFESANFSAMIGLFDIDGAGDITQDIGSSLIVPNLDADAANVTLDEATNDFATIGITADVASIADANSLVLNDVQIVSSFTLNVTSGPSTQTIGSAISGTGSLTKAGLGTLILSEANTYTGTTDIIAGDLQVNGEIGNGGPAGTVTVQSGATLSGSGTVNADVFGQAGSFISATGNGFTLGNAASASGFETAGALDGNGFSVTLNDADTALLGSVTDLNGGTLSATNGVTVGNGDTFQGLGTVQTSAGALTIQSGGTLSPGNSPGIINTNNLVLESGSIYVVELNASYQTPGTDYDQTNVTGSVTLNDATLQLQGGVGAPVAGTSVILIQNDGTDSLLGTGTFNGLAQGDMVTIGDFTGHINYFGGDGNDVTLEVAGAFVFSNTGGGDVTVRQNTANGTIEILKGGVLVASRSSAGVTEIIINGDMIASDTLTVDYTGSFFTQTVTFNGGENLGDSDALIITGGTFGRAEHTFTGTETGTILYDVDGNTASATDQGMIVYAELEPVDMTGSTITDLVFNLPAGDDQAVLEDDGVAGNGISQIRSQNGTFETTTFANPTGSLTINTEALGGNGTDLVNVQGLDSLYDADLTINAGTDDTVNFQTATTDLGTGTLTVTAMTINVNQAVSTSGTGAIDLDATRNIAVSSTGSLTTIDGAIDLDANQGAPTSGNFAGIAINGGLVTSTNGAITLDGRGGDTGNGNYGVFLSGGGQITSTGTATVDVTGIGGNGPLVNIGVRILGSGAAIRSQDGAITVTGTGGDGGDFNQGVILEAGGQIESIGTATVNVTGTGGNGTSSNQGVVIMGSNSAILSENGAITVTGTGGDGGALSDGVRLSIGGRIESTGTATVNVTGMGGNGTTLNRGVSISGISSISAILSQDGAITVTGTGGNGSGAGNHGVVLEGGGQIEATGTAMVNVTGTGGNGTDNNHGVYLNDSFLTGNDPAILSQTGAITVTGTAGAGANSRAVFLQNTATIGGPTTSGTVLLDGNGGVIEFQDASGIQTTNNTLAAVTIRDASDVILGNVSAVNGGLVIGVAQDVTGSVTQALGTALDIINLTASTDITTATPILLDSATNEIVTIGQIERGGALTIVDSTGGLTVNGPINSVLGTLDPVTITTTGGNLVIAGAIASAGGGDISLTSTDADLLVNANVTANAPGNVTLTGQNVILNGSTVEVIGVVPNNIISTTPRNGIVQGLGIITINATGLTDLNANSTLRTGGGVIQITTDDIDIAGTATINSNQANNGVVIIRNASAGRNIELGGNTMVGVLGINDAELDRIGAQSLRIGRLDNIANAGTITITNTFSASLAALPTVQLFAGGDITQLGGAGFIAGNIGVETNGSVVLGSSLNDAINSFAALAVGGILFNDLNALTVNFIADAVDSALPADGEAGISGVTSTTSFVDLRTVNGNLTILDIAADPIEVSAGGVNPLNNLAINFLAAGANTFININAGANVTSLAGAHRYTADNMAINGTITASPTDFSVNLRNANANAAINLGAIADAGANTLELSDAELDNITTNLLAIGRNTGNVSGNITVTSAINPGGTDTLHLLTAGTVIDAVGGAIVETNLLIEAANGAVLDNLASHDVDVLAGIVTNPGANFTFRDLDNLTVGIVERLTVTLDANETAGLSAANGITTNGRTAGDVGGDVLLISETGGVIVNQPITTTANSAGRNSGSITINALGTGTILVNAALDTRGTTAGGNGQGGDILLTTMDGSISINAGSLLATGGGLPSVDGGNITIDANGATSDVTVTGNLTTNDIAGGLTRGNISITADDSVTINGDLSTTGLGTVTITANDSLLGGDSDGALTMNIGSSISAEMGLVTLRTLADVLDQASITVEQITTTTGNVLIDANGLSADVILRNTIATTNGNVDVLADDSVNVQATGMILVSGIGNVLVRANQDVLDGPGNDEILMAGGSLISTNTGTITLRTDGTGGGNITLGRLVTQNITNQAVTINSQSAVLDGNAGGVNIEAVADANSRVNIIAQTGIGVGDAIETSARRFDVQNQGAADINIANTTTNLDVIIEKMTTVGGNIAFDNQSGSGLLTIGDAMIAGTRISSGDALTDGGDITITTSADLRVIAPISSRDGRGGMFTLTGGAMFDAGAVIELGAGDINITTGSLDILFNSDLDIINGPAQFLAPRDIIVGALLRSLVDDGTGTDNFVDATTTAVQNNSPIDSHITLQADTVSDGVGGVLVRGSGQIIASGNLTLEGSDLFADGLLTIAPVTMFQNGVHIERDPVNQPQLLVAGELTLQNRPNVAAADIVIGGTFGTQSATAGPNLTVRIDANDNIYLADNATVFSPADVIFGDGTGRDPVIDDGDISTPSNLVINAGGTTTFFGRVGAIDPAMDATDNLDSLTTNIGGQTHVRGGIVSTDGVQLYGDDVFINADTNQFDNTTFTAGGNVNFLGSIFGLDLGVGVIQDDLVLNIAGTTTISGLVGVNSTTDLRRIGDGTGAAVTVNSTGETIFNNQVFIESGFLQNNAAGRITFKEDVNIDFDQNLGGVGSVFNADVTLDSLTINSNGELTFGNNAPNEDELFVLVGSRLNTGSESRNITINSRLVDPVENMVTPNEDLFLNLNQGDLVINGSVGDLSMLNRFGDLVIQSANGFTFNGNNTTVTLASESLTQWDGIDNPSDADPFASTVLNGLIDVTNKLQLTPMDPTGITLATGNVVYNATITTNGGRILTQARSNISHTATSSMNTLGGMVVSDAVGVIIMNEGSTINTNNLIGNGGMVVMQSGSDTIISKIVSTNGFVGLIAGGAIIDGGDQNLLGSANDIQTAQLRLQAGTGIGVVGNPVLETEVSNLETLNGTGRTLISNTGNLTIGGVGAPTVETVRTFIMDSGTAFTSVFTTKPIALPSIGGMKNLNGDIGLTNTGDLTALGGTLMQSTNGSVALFVQGSAVFGGQVQAVNNGHIFVDVSGNFTLLNGQAQGDLQTDGIGQIVVTADGAVNFNPDSGAMVQSGTGTIRQPRPAVPLQLISTPQVTTEGVATLTFTVGLPGEENFQVIIDWGDGGPLEIQNVDAGQHTIEHDYVEPPDPTSPGAPIRIFLVVSNDPNIHFFGNNLSQPLPAGNATLLSLDPPTTGALPKPAPPSAQLGTFLFPNQGGALTINQFVDLAINPLNFNTLALPNALDFINQSLSSIANINQMFPLLAGNVDDLGVVSAVPVFQVPTTAFGGAAIIDLREIPPIFVPGNTSNPLPDESDDFDDDAEDLEFSGSSTEEQGEDEVIVRLRVLSPAGQKLFEYEIDPKYLSNPAPLWARLTDGRYQIVIEEPGSSVPIVVRDVELRDHKVIRTFDRTRRDSDAEARFDGGPKDAAVSLEDFSFLLPGALEEIYAPTPSGVPVPVTEPGPDAVWENWRPPHAANRLSRQMAEPEEAADAPTAASAFAGGLALATLAKRSKKEPDSQMRDFSKRTLSPAARLRRRLRK